MTFVYIPVVLLWVGRQASHSFSQQIVMAASEETLINAYIACCVFYHVFMLSTNYLLYRSRNQEFLRQRFISLVILSQLVAVWNGNISLVGLLVWHQYLPFPCWVRILQQYSGGPLYMFLILFRTILTAHKYVVQKLSHDPTARLSWFEVFLIKSFSDVKSKQFQTPSTMTHSTQGHSSHGHSSTGEEQNRSKQDLTSSQLEQQVGETKVTGQTAEVAKTQETRTPSQLEQPTDTKDVPQVTVTSSGTEENQVRSLTHSHPGHLIGQFQIASFVPWRIIWKYIAWFCVLELFFLAQTYLTWPSYMNAASCPPESDTARIVIQYLMIIVIAFVLYFIKDAEDSVHLKNEMWASNVIELICFGFYIALKYLPNSSPWQIGLGASIYNLIMYLLENVFTVSGPLLYSWYLEGQKRKNKDVGNQEYSQLRLILDKPASRKKFKAIILKQLCVENLEFYLDYTKLLSTYPNFKTDAKQKKKLIVEMKKLFTKYIEPGSPFELNLPTKLVKPIIEKFKAPEVDPEEMKPIFMAVLEMMQLNTYPVYKRENADA